MTRHVQIIKNNKFAISLQHVKREVSDAVNILHADKHESLLQIDTKIFRRYGQAFPKFLKKRVCNVFTISLTSFIKVS